MLRAISEIAVAMTVASVVEKPTSRASPLARDHDVRVDADLGARRSHVRLRSAIEERLAEDRTELTLQQMGAAVQSCLPPRVPGREREQDRPAPRGGRLTVHLDQVLDAELGPAPVQPGGDRTGSRSDVVSEGLDVGAVDLMGHEQRLLVRTQPAERGADGRLLLAQEQLVLGL
jgi:hypothetical protein